jgi:hypothetical protein
LEDDGVLLFKRKGVGVLLPQSKTEYAKLKTLIGDKVRTFAVAVAFF